MLLSIAYEGEGRDGYRDQIVTCDVGVSLHSKTHPLFMKYSNSTSIQCYAYNIIILSLSELVSCAFSTIPICPFLIQRIFHSLIILSNRVVRQYRACVVDLLGLGIHMCGVLLYYAYNPSRSCLPSFCAIPIFHFLI